MPKLETDSFEYRVNLYNFLNIPNINKSPTDDKKGIFFKDLHSPTVECWIIWAETKVEWWQATRVPQQLSDTSTSLISSLSKKQGICSYC